MLEKVRFIWIKGLLECSLNEVVRLELGLTIQPDAVECPVDLLVQRPEQPPQPLPVGIPLRQVFEEAGQALLILGAPGAGKTTLLLELTRDLLDQAEQHENHLIPVIFNLASWAKQRLAFADWLVDELNKRYDVPRKLAKNWVESELVLPLLDGLDEVASAHREACVAAINAFIHQHGLLPLVVCSRVADYEGLSTRLRLPSAVAIQPLTRQQIDDYLVWAGEPLAGVRTALRDDATLWELFETPLMLSITALAYQGYSTAEMSAVSALPQNRQRHLFATYVERMFKRPGRAKPQGKAAAYTSQQTVAWLAWLAATMKHHSQTAFHLGWMQPTWLASPAEERLFRVGVGIFSGLLFGLLFGLVNSLVNGLGLGLVVGLVVLIKSPLMGGLLGWLLFGLVSGLLGGLGTGLSSGLLGGLGAGLREGLHGGLAGGLSRYSAGTVKPLKVQPGLGCSSGWVSGCSLDWVSGYSSG
jgi:DNA polymerase III delta prime subunit